MSGRLPETIDPLYLADKRGSLIGHLPLNSLSRLADVLFDDKGDVCVELFFERSGSLAKIEGRLQAVLELTCQNCLKAVVLPVDCLVKLGVVSSIEQANRLPEEYEPLLLEGELIVLSDIIEDELLLNVPIFPKHSHSCFVSTLGKTGLNPVTKDLEPSSVNPFSVLTNLKILENTNGSTKK